MTGESDLKTLIRTMRPRLRPETFVFATLAPGEAPPAGIAALMSFTEAEGTTLIVEEAVAATAGLEAVFVARMITLEVHSALAAVGFLAAVTARLAAAGISTNAVSAVYHDHLFVPADRGEAALRVLRAMAADAAGG